MPLRSERVGDTSAGSARRAADRVATPFLACPVEGGASVATR